MKPKQYFKTKPAMAKKYEIMKAFFEDGKSACDLAKKYNYSVTSIYTLTKKFRKDLKENPRLDPFFITPKKGRPFKENSDNLIELIVALRKKNLSVPDIKTIIDTQPEYDASESYIDYILKQEGFARLPRRSIEQKHKIELPEKLKAEKSKKLDFFNEKFSSNELGILAFLPIIRKYKLDKIIQKSSYPYTKTISRYASIMSFVALKLSNVSRYTKDDLWCMNRGLGLFAGLNVLPKAAWFTSYSDRVTIEMNLSFLKELHAVWQKEGLLGDTVNLDFTTIPYWGDGAHLENNWSGKRNKALSSMLAILAQDSDTGIINYGSTDVKHSNQNEIVLEFLDFYRAGSQGNGNLNYLVFDSKFTAYQNLRKLDDNKIKFLTIRRRGKSIVNKINKIPSSDWKKIKVECAGNKNRTLKVHDERIFLKGYGKEIRQIAITGHGKIKPALIITNDFDEKIEVLIRKYTRRWLVEKCISEQIEFFHLNRVSSSMVIKVDFDLTISILAHNIYRIFSLEFDRYNNFSDQSIYEKFINNSGEIEITDDEVKIYMKKKRNLPGLISVLQKFSNQKYFGLKNKKLGFYASSST